MCENVRDYKEYANFKSTLTQFETIKTLGSHNIKNIFQSLEQIARCQGPVTSQVQAQCQSSLPGHEQPGEL